MLSIAKTEDRTVDKRKVKTTFSSSLTTVVALRTWWEGAWLPYEDEMVVVSMSVREEDDSKSDTTQNLFKHSPVLPPPTPPLSPAVADPTARCWDVFTPAGCLYVTAAAEKLSTVPTLSLGRSQHAGSQSQDTWPPVRPSARTHAPLTVWSRAAADRRGDRRSQRWGPARRGGGADGRGRLSSFLLHFAHMRGGHGEEATGREKASSAKSERAASSPQC